MDELGNVLFKASLSGIGSVAIWEKGLTEDPRVVLGNIEEGLPGVPFATFQRIAASDQGVAVWRESRTENGVTPSDDSGVWVVDCRDGSPVIESILREG